MATEDDGIYIDFGNGIVRFFFWDELFNMEEGEM